MVISSLRWRKRFHILPNKEIISMRRFILVLAGTLAAIASFAQEYEQSAGLRLGHSGGLTYKKFIVNEQAFEFMLTGRNNGVQVTGLYLNHIPLSLSFNESRWIITTLR